MNFVIAIHKILSTKVLLLSSTRFTVNRNISVSSQLVMKWKRR